MNLKSKIIATIAISAMIFTSSLSLVQTYAINNDTSISYTKLEQSQNYLEKGILILNMGLYGNLNIYDPSGQHVYELESGSTIYYKSKVIVPIPESGIYTFEVEEKSPQDGGRWEIEYTQQLFPQTNAEFEIGGKNDNIIVFNSPVDQTMNLEINYEGAPVSGEEYGTLNQLNKDGEILKEILYFENSTGTYNTQINISKGINILEVFYTKGRINWNVKASSPQKDDIVGSWAEKEIRDFIDKGYISGRPDGNFAPQDQIKRGEFVKILNKTFGLTQKSGITFSDTQYHWAKDEIDIAVTNGVCEGISETEFAPDNYITRQEAARMIANYLKISDQDHDKISAFPDYNEVADWAVDYLEAVVEHGYIKGTPEGKLNPIGLLTRAESVVMLSRIEVKN